MQSCVFVLDWSQVTVEKQIYLESKKGGRCPGTWWGVQLNVLILPSVLLHESER